MAKNLEAYDAALLGILQHEGQIAGFLDAVLGFLYRRTDFYRIMKSKDDKMGFPQGVAPKILLSAYKKYEDLARTDEKEREQIIQRKIQKATENTVPPAAKIVEITSEGDQSNNSMSEKREEKMSTATDSEGTTKGGISNGHKVQAENNNSLSKSTKDREIAIDNKDTDDNDPELTKKQKIFQSKSESYNGAVRDNYSWSQSITDVDVHVQIPSYIVKGRDVKVDIEKQHLKVCYKTNKGSWEEVVNGDLTWGVNKEESMWSLAPKEHVHINLEKREERWWESLLDGEEKISVRKIDASRPMTDLDDEAQAKIEEMMYNEHQKRLGKPTSQEQKVQDILKGAWDAEGSPFKGQPFDPSKISVNQGGVVSINQEEPS